MIIVSDKIKQALNASSRFIKYKVAIYLDGEAAEPIDITEDVMSFDTLDETVSGTLPFGEVTYNELSIVLNNLSNKYTITNTNSPYAGKLVSGVKVEVTYLVETEPDIFEPVVGGIYYTDDWSVSSEANTATLTCYDYLAQVGYKQIEKFKVQTNITVYEAFQILFAAGGVPSNKYSITPTLTTVLPYYWCSAEDLRTCLSDLALLTQTVVYADRHGIIHVDDLVSDKNTDISLSDNTVVMSTKTEPSYSNVYSGVRVKYPVIIGAQVTEVYKGEKILLKPGNNLISNILFTSTPVILIAGIKVMAGAICRVVDYSYTDSTCSLVINNTSTEAQSVSIIIEGQVVQTVDSSHYVEQSAASNNILELTLPIASTEEFVSVYASRILSLFTSYVSNIELQIVGYPIVDIHDRVYLDSNVSDIHNIMQVVRVSNTFNNGMDTTAVVRYIQEVTR